MYSTGAYGSKYLRSLSQWANIREHFRNIAASQSISAELP
jgi:hypothetical protein